MAQPVQLTKIVKEGENASISSKINVFLEPMLYNQVKWLWQWIRKLKQWSQESQPIFTVSLDFWCAWTLFVIFRDSNISFMKETTTRKLQQKQFHRACFTQQVNRLWRLRRKIIWMYYCLHQSIHPNRWGERKGTKIINSYLHFFPSYLWHLMDISTLPLLKQSPEAFAKWTTCISFPFLVNSVQNIFLSFTCKSEASLVNHITNCRITNRQTHICMIEDECFGRIMSTRLHPWQMMRVGSD